MTAYFSCWLKSWPRLALLVTVAILLDHGVARAFMKFVRSAAARKIIESYGYQVPADSTA